MEILYINLSFPAGFGIIYEIDNGVLLRDKTIIFIMDKAIGKYFFRSVVQMYFAYQLVLSIQLQSML